MRTTIAFAAATLMMSFSGMATATTISDPTGDFLKTFVDDHDPDLDVTSFSVTFDSATSSFLLGATLAGAINPAKTGLYAIGVNTGAGAAQPFIDIGKPKVIFDQVVVVNKDGTGLVTGPTGGALSSIKIDGNAFSAVVPLSMLPSTGFAPDRYGFNLWPRTGLADNSQIADFAPDNATLSVAAVPEPASWAMLISGVGFTGAALRRRRLTPTEGFVAA